MRSAGFIRSHTMISIHAPPRGATRLCAYPFNRLLFQFTPLREGRRLLLVGITGIKIFQFTPLREGRHRLGKRGFFRAYFNSRPSARGDALMVCNTGLSKISIHAPPRGAT